MICQERFVEIALSLQFYDTILHLRLLIYLYKPIVYKTCQY
jgi:hypothetical protein